MSSPDSSLTVLAPLRHALETGRLAHSFLIVGSPDGRGLALAEELVRLLFCTAAQKPCHACEGCERVARRQHPDVYWLEPAKKSRILSVDQIRELNQRLGQTAYAGGWKVGALLHAERMNTEAMNALLNTMEEPPGRTPIILVTDQAQGLLPTIVSRCQRINLGEKERPADAPWRAELEAWLAEAGARGPVTALARAARLKNLLESVKDAIQEEEDAAEEALGEADVSGGEDVAEDEDGDDANEVEVSNDVRDARVKARLVKERAAILRAIQLWQRDLLACRLGASDEALHYPWAGEALRRQSERVEVAVLLNRIRAVDDASRRLDRNLSDLLVLESLVLAGV